MRGVAAFVLVGFFASRAISLAQSAPNALAADAFPRDEPVAQAAQSLNHQREVDRLVTAEPESPATIKALIRAGRADQALDVFDRIVRTRPDALDQAISEIRETSWLSSHSLDPREALLGARADASLKEGQAVLATLPAEQQNRQSTRAAYIEYSRLPYAQRLAAYDSLISEQPGTPLAIQVEAWRIGVLTGERPWREGLDYSTQLRSATESLERLLARPEVHAEVADGALRSVLQVVLPSRLSGRVGPDDARVVDVMRAFVRRNRGLLGHERLSGSFRGLAFAKLPEAIEAVRGPRAVAGYFDELSSWLPTDEASLIRADYDIDRTFERLEERRRFESTIAARETARTRRNLRDLMDRSQGSIRQRAQAILAAVEFRVGNVRVARSLLDDYVARYPDAGWAWVAALHAAQATQVIESPTAAAAQFEAVGLRYVTEPTVSAIAAFYQARALEASGQVAKALEAYHRALQSWEGSLDTWSGLDWPVAFERDATTYAMWPREIERTAVAARVAELTRAGTELEGTARARARWLLEHFKPVAARDVTRAAVRRQPDLEGDAEFTALRHRAEHDAAVEMATRSSKGRRTARRDLSALCEEPFDSWVGLGCAALASLQAIDGREQEAVATFTRSLAKWQQRQTESAAAAPLPEPGSIEHDVLAIRDVLFQPRAGGIYGTRRFTTRENGDLPPFLLMPSQLSATLIDRPGHVLVRATQQPPGISNAVFLESIETKTLWETAVSLSGCEGRHLTRHARLFTSVVGWPPRYCMLGGSWLTLPSVGRVNFANTERTRAEVPVGTGESGLFVVVEKADGAWRIHSVRSSWVE